MNPPASIEDCDVILLGEGLSVHYSGGSTLSADVAALLDANGIPRK